MKYLLYYSINPVSNPRKYENEFSTTQTYQTHLYWWQEVLSKRQRTFTDAHEKMCIAHVVKQTKKGHNTPQGGITQAYLLKPERINELQQCLDCFILSAGLNLLKLDIIEK